MSQASIGESGVNYYLDVLCDKADHAFQFAYACLLERTKAFEAVKKAYLELADNLPAPGDGDSDVQAVIAVLWKHVNSAQAGEATRNDHRIFANLFAKLSIDERAVLVLVDYLGFDIPTTFRLLSKDEGQVMQLLSQSRKALVAANL